MLTVTIMHDQHLGINKTSEQGTALAFHWSQGAALLNQTLIAGVKPSERDAIWACAALLGALSLASIDAKTPEEAWPLKPSAQSDLDWLKMTEGKRVLWKLADPLRPDSIYYPLAPDFMQSASPSHHSVLELHKLDPAILRLCRLHKTPIDEDDPYLPSASFLARTADMECNAQNLVVFLSFFGCMHPVFKQLLARKDPPALVLFCIWYAKMIHCRQWWIYRRACLEGQAICRYLRLYHGDDADVRSAIQYPEMVFA